MKAVWYLETEEGESIGEISMEGNWSDATFRTNFIKFVNKMDRDSSIETVKAEEN